MRTTTRTPKKPFDAANPNRPEWAYFSRLFCEAHAPTDDLARDLEALRSLFWRALATKRDHVILKYCRWQIDRCRAVLGARWSGSRGELLADFGALVLAYGHASTPKSVINWDPSRGGLGAYMAGRGTLAMHTLIAQRKVDGLTACVGTFADGDDCEAGVYRTIRYTNLWTGEEYHVSADYDLEVA